MKHESHARFPHPRPSLALAAELRVQIDRTVAEHARDHFAHLAGEPIDVVLAVEVGQPHRVEPLEAMPWWKDHDVALAVQQ
jgi:hypothetical protein